MSDNTEDCAGSGGALVGPGTLFPSDEPRLPYDVLYELARHIYHSGSRSSLFALMSTCRTLSNACATVLLSGKVNIGKTLRLVSSFCAFVLRRESRASSIRHLHIRTVDTWPFADITISSVMYALSLVITRATRLETLHITEVDHFLSISPDIGPAISSLTTLTHLKLEWIGIKAQAMCMDMHSPISTVVLHNLEASGILDPDPTVLLQNFQDTLVDVTIDIQPILERPVWVFSGASFPHVRSLKLVTRSVYQELLPFMKAFPNVSTFHWRDDRPYPTHWLPMLDQSHAYHLAATHGHWPELSVLNAPMLSCYIAGLQSRVRRYSMTIVGSGGDQWYQARLNSLLRLIRPFALWLQTSAALFFNRDVMGWFPVSSIKELRLKISTESVPASKAQYLMELVPYALRRMSLTSLVLTIQHIAEREEFYMVMIDGTPVEDHPSAKDPFYNYLDNTALVTTARLLADYIPTLEDVFLGIKLSENYQGPFRSYYVNLQVRRDEHGSRHFRLVKRQDSASLFDFNWGEPS
ncbi:hypothetical protein BXZ70DRAFT_592066 [Cristinia sonorae]|uniref:Uncharacterized protein n=1 Tax=Cristinia sonorae TaxID=1940300 RepID=A0A8K0UUD8_9AGAR|nr:hypothetical protein BXZ70DRAFT_592066 [Cristinia sonorae]